MLSNFSYELDAAGNRKSVMEDGVKTNYIVAASERNLLTSVAGAAYTYDGRGNVIGTGNVSYAYDLENRLNTVTRAGQTIASYWYDAAGNRVRSYENGVAINYVYDGLNVIQEHDPVADARTDYVFGYGKQLAKVKGGVRHTWRVTTWGPRRFSQMLLARHWATTPTSPTVTSQRHGTPSWVGR